MQVAKGLENEGYSVVLAPTPEIIPFSLGGYHPDILASKGAENLIVEIKSRESPDHAKSFRKIIEIVEKHPHWRFLIKTVGSSNVASDQKPLEIIPVSAIEKHLLKADDALAAGVGEFVIPYLWNAAIALLRHKAVDSGLSVDLSDRSLVNQLYTMGVISGIEYEDLMQWQQLRNSATHEISFDADPASVQAFSKYVKSLLASLKDATREDEQEVDPDREVRLEFVRTCANPFEIAFLARCSEKDLLEVAPSCQKVGRRDARGEGRIPPKHWPAFRAGPGLLLPMPRVGRRSRFLFFLRWGQVPPSGIFPTAR